MVTTLRSRESDLHTGRVGPQIVAYDNRADTVGSNRADVNRPYTRSPTKERLLRIFFFTIPDSGSEEFFLGTLHCGEEQRKHSP